MIFDGEDKRPEQHPNSCEGEGGPVNLKTSTRVVNGIVIVDIIGQLRLGEGTNVVRDLVRDLMGKSYKNILLNLADVRHIDSAGVGELMSCYTSVRNQGKNPLSADFRRIGADFGLNFHEAKTLCALEPVARSWNRK